MKIKVISLIVFGLTSISGFAQGASSGTGFSPFGGPERTVTVSSIVIAFLKSMGEIPGEEWSDTGGKPGPIPRTTEVMHQNFRSVLFDKSPDLYVVENTRMMRNGGPSWRKESRYASINNFQQVVEEYCKSINLNFLKDDTYKLSGIYFLEGHTISAQEAKKLYRNGGRPYYELTYGLRSYGFDNREKVDYLYFAADVAKGDLLYFRRRIDTARVSGFQGQHKDSKAALEVAKSIKANQSYQYIGEFWVKANIAWNAPPPSDEDSLRLAHIFVFGKDEIWVDSYTGKLLGGQKG
jgi:hypothetical protein